MDTDLDIPVIQDNGLYDTIAAGGFLGFKPATLRNARHSGKLAGVEPPAFMKMGAAVRYRGKTLREWREQFVEKTRTSKAAKLCFPSSRIRVSKWKVPK